MDRLNKTISLGDGVTFLVQPEDWSATTIYPDGYSSYAQRMPTEENKQEALDEGYRDCWNALVDHELLHTVMSRLLFGHPNSRVIRHAAGADNPRYAERLFEESVVLSFQYWLNTRTIDQVLDPFISRLEEVESAYRHFKDQVPNRNATTEPLRAT